MNLPEHFNGLFKAPRLTGTRIALALAVAAGADGLQLLFMQFGWVGPDQVIDFLAMIVIASLIGFHVLLLPTFVVELIPVLDDLPTWIACTAAVIALRKREQRLHPPSVTTPVPPPVPKTDKPVIDV